MLDEMWKRHLVGVNLTRPSRLKPPCRSSVAILATDDRGLGKKWDGNVSGDA